MTSSITAASWSGLQWRTQSAKPEHIPDETLSLSHTNYLTQ